MVKLLTLSLSLLSVPSTLVLAANNWKPGVGGDWKTLSPTASPLGNINPTGSFALVAQTLNPANFHKPNDKCEALNVGHQKHCTTETLTDYSTDCGPYFTEYYNSVYDAKKSSVVQGPKTTNSWDSCSRVPFYITKTKCDMVYETPTPKPSSITTSTLTSTLTSTPTPTPITTTVSNPEPIFLKDDDNEVVGGLEPEVRPIDNNKDSPDEDTSVYEGLIAHAYEDGQIEVQNEECVDDDDGKLHYACYDPYSLMVTIVDGIIYDEQGRVGSIVLNSQFQFDGPPPQAGTRFAAGWSLTDNYYLALGDQTIFYECPQDDGYKLYGYKLYDDICKEVMLKAVGIIHDCFPKYE